MSDIFLTLEERIGIAVLIAQHSNNETLISALAAYRMDPTKAGRLLMLVKLAGTAEDFVAMLAAKFALTDSGSTVRPADESIFNLFPHRGLWEFGPDDEEREWFLHPIFDDHPSNDSFRLSCELILAEIVLHGGFSDPAKFDLIDNARDTNAWFGDGTRFGTMWSKILMICFGYRLRDPRSPLAQIREDDVLAEIARHGGLA